MWANSVLTCIVTCRWSGWVAGVGVRVGGVRGFNGTNGEREKLRERLREECVSLHVCLYMDMHMCGRVLPGIGMRASGGQGGWGRKGVDTGTNKTLAASFLPVWPDTDPLYCYFSFALVNRHPRQPRQPRHHYVFFCPPYFSLYFFQKQVSRGHKSSSTK